MLYHHVWACYECLLWRDIWQKYKWCGMYCEYYTWYGVLHGWLYVCVCVERELLLVETDFIHYYNIQSFFLIFRCQLPLALLPCSTFICTMQRHNAVRHIPIHDARWRISVVYVCLCVQYAKLQNGQNMQNIWYHQHQQILLCVIHMCIYYMFGVFAVRSSKREKKSDTHENISISIYLYIYINVK